MWMMGYNDGSDSFNGGRKLRPLIPRPLPSSTSASSSNLPPCLDRIHGTDLFALNQHLAAVAEQNKRELNNTPQVVVSSRWNPTPEQLRTLEELYRRGTRTPSADEIQHITAQLRRYGKIEGKNVFYWFQNHKARERQKRRRQIMESDYQHFERKESGASRTGYEVEQTKNWAPSTNCTTLSEESPGSTERSAKAMVEECRTTDGWIQLDESVELQHQRKDNIVQRNDTWQMMQSLSCPPHNHTHLINTTITTTTEGEGPTTTSSATMDQNVLKTHDLNIFLRPFRSEPNCLNHINSVGSAVSCCNNINLGNGDGSCGESPTLQLFPLQSEENMKEKEEIDLSVAAMNSNFTTPYHFFEFLPLKN